MSGHRQTLLDLTRNDVAEQDLVLLTRLDVQGNGKVRTDDLIQFMTDLQTSKNEKKQWKCAAGIAVAGVLGFIAIIFGLICAGFQMTKETKISNNDQLTTMDGNPVVLGTVINSKSMTSSADLMTTTGIRNIFGPTGSTIDVSAKVSFVDVETRKGGGTWLYSPVPERMNFWVNDSVGASTLRLQYRTLAQFAAGSPFVLYSTVAPVRRRLMPDHVCPGYLPPGSCGGNGDEPPAGTDYETECEDLMNAYSWAGSCSKNVKHCKHADSGSIHCWLRCTDPGNYYWDYSKMCDDCPKGNSGC